MITFYYNYQKTTNPVSRACSKSFDEYLEYVVKCLDMDKDKKKQYNNAYKNKHQVLCSCGRRKRDNRATFCRACYIQAKKDHSAKAKKALIESQRFIKKIHAMLKILKTLQDLSTSLKDKKLKGKVKQLN